MRYGRDGREMGETRETDEEIKREQTEWKT